MDKFTILNAVLMDQSTYISHLTEEAIKAENISAGKCFLCGQDPSSGAGEHVIPKWLQRRYDLYDKQLTLLNGTLLFYRNLTVPACSSCNNKTLKRTEDFVSNIIPSNITDWTPNHSFEVGRWMAKIFLGVLIKETSLSLNMKHPAEGSIVPTNYIGELFFIHLLIQSWRKKITFNCLHTIHPFTLYVYQIEEDPLHSNFDMTTNVIGQSICIRFGGLGFAFVADGGLQHHSGRLGPFGLAFQKLHPIQFSEIAARIHYKAALRNVTHKYLFHEDLETFTLTQTAVAPYSNTKLSNGEMELFKPWDDSEFKYALQAYGIPNIEHLTDNNGTVKFTRLVDEAGKLLQLSKICKTGDEGT
ncbi:MAG: hypothetical protein ABJK43_17710 [Lentilitoribacter sp.]